MKANAKKLPGPALNIIYEVAEMPFSFNKSRSMENNEFENKTKQNNKQNKQNKTKQKQKRNKKQQQEQTHFQC